MCRSDCCISSFRASDEDEKIWGSCNNSLKTKIATVTRAPSEREIKKEKTTWRYNTPIVHRTSFPVCLRGRWDRQRSSGVVRGRWGRQGSSGIVGSRLSGSPGVLTEISTTIETTTLYIALLRWCCWSHFPRAAEVSWNMVTGHHGPHPLLAPWVTWVNEAIFLESAGSCWWFFRRFVCLFLCLCLLGLILWAWMIDEKLQQLSGATGCSPIFMGFISQKKRIAQ